MKEECSTLSWIMDLLWFIPKILEKSGRTLTIHWWLLFLTMNNVNELFQKNMESYWVTSSVVQKVEKNMFKSAFRDFWIISLLFVQCKGLFAKATRWGKSRDLFIFLWKWALIIEPDILCEGEDFTLCFDIFNWKCLWLVYRWLHLPLKRISIKVT